MSSLASIPLILEAATGTGTFAFTTFYFSSFLFSFSTKGFLNAFDKSAADGGGGGGGGAPLKLIFLIN